MRHPSAVHLEGHVLDRQTVDPQQHCCPDIRDDVDALKLRSLNQARDLTFVTMNCLDNSHDHRGHGPYRVTTKGPACPVKFEEPVTAAAVALLIGGMVGLAVIQTVEMVANWLVQSGNTQAALGVLELTQPGVPGLLSIVMFIIGAMGGCLVMLSPTPV
jgi:hypothetical protein